VIARQLTMQAPHLLWLVEALVGKIEVCL